MLAKIAVTLGAGLGIGMVTANATAASLSVAVSPAVLHPGVRYVVTVSGRYSPGAGAPAPYLLAFIQYTGQPCRPTATAEYALPSADWSWDIYPQLAEPRSPFKRVDDWQAGPGLGSRRVCAYLYANAVTPSSTAVPLARAGVTFRNTRNSRR